MLRRVEHLHRYMFQEFFLRRKIPTLQVTRVVHQNFRVASLLSNLCERIGYGVARHQIQLDNHAVAALLLDCRLQGRRVGRAAGGENDEKALLCELLGYCAADAPTHAHRKVAVIEHPAVRQLGIPAI